MILTDEETRAKHLGTGVWGTVTLDAIFRKSVQMHPDRLAIADAPDRAEWTSGKSEQLTYAEADNIVSRMAVLFSHLGLSPDHVVGVMMPNATITALTYLAAWRCGLIVAPIPLTWRNRSINPALAAIGTKAIITMDRLENEDLGTPIRDIAAELFGIRQLLGFGDRLAEGIINIDQAAAEIDAAEMPTEVNRKENAADHVATITFTCTAEGQVVPVPRSHNQWIAMGLMPLLEARIEAGASILSPHMLTGLSGIGAGLVPWLLSSGTLHMHHFRNLSGLSDHCATTRPDHLLCPAGLVNPLSNMLKEKDIQTDMLAIWHGCHVPAAPASVSTQVIVDVTVLDELALVARARGDNPIPHPLPLGEISVPTDAEQALTLVELQCEKVEADPTGKRETRELLLVRGPMAPSTEVMRTYDFVPTTPKGYLETSILAEVTPGQRRTATPVSRSQDLIMIGGLPLANNEVVDAYSDHDAVRASRLYVSGQKRLVPKMALAVVPEHAARFSPQDADDYAKAAGLALHARPASVIRSVSVSQTPKRTEQEGEDRDTDAAAKLADAIGMLTRQSVG